MKIGPSNIKKNHLFSSKKNVDAARNIRWKVSHWKNNKTNNLTCTVNILIHLFFSAEKMLRIEDKGNEKSTHFQETTMLDDAVYVNTQFSSQERLDTGQDYQNAILPLKPAKVSAKIQNVVNALQVR